MVLDALIIGGGVIGLSIARELHKNGVRRIAVADRGRLGGEASWAAAGMLAPNAECDEADDFHRFCSESASLYPKFAAELLEETGVDIELDRTGTLYLAFSDSDAATVRRRHQWQKLAGIEVELLSAGGTVAVEPFVSEDVRESLLFPNDWQVENRKLIEALRKYCVENGIEVLEHSKVNGFLVDNGRVTAANTITGKLFADFTIVAAGAWTTLVNPAGNILPFEVRPIRGQMLCFRADNLRLRHVIYSSRGYLVPRADGRILAGSTVEDAGFEKNVTADATRRLRAVATEIAPRLRAEQPADQWAGLRPFVPPDGLPVIGGLPGVENLFVATGHYRNGILLAPITAKIVVEKILGRAESEYLRLYGLNRFANAAGGQT